ncbi:MAG: hypothetical protein J7527_12380, partial [Chitinophagaceae bacterium]|nr:hypothetical protein [Chitinophagaceae bacterium]
MTSIKKYLVLCGTCLSLSFGLAAQFNISSAITVKPPKNRELFHDYIDKEQKDLLAADGNADASVTFSSNEEINLLLANAIVRDVDEFQYAVEADSLLEHRLKVNYLTGMSNMLRYVKNNWRSKKVNLLHLPQIIDAYKECIVADRATNSI